MLLTIEAVSIRPFMNEDAVPMALLANNIHIWNNLRDRFPHPYMQKDAIDFITMAQKEKPPQNFAITYHQELAGVIGLMPQYDVYHRSAEVGYWLGEPFWYKGIAAKALTIITQYAFEQLQLARIYAGVFQYNTASMRVLEKGGFQLEGVLKKAVCKNNRLWDEYRYGKTIS